MDQQTELKPWYLLQSTKMSGSTDLLKKITIKVQIGKLQISV